MNVPDLTLDRTPHLSHHLSQAKAWLSASSDGKHVAASSYAAFELRLAAERICLQYYVRLVGNAAKGKLESLRFSRLKERIFATAGHQRKINEQFDFMRAILRVLGIDATAPTPDLGRLSRIWHDCSEACHVVWNLGTTKSGLPPECSPHRELASYIEELEALARATVMWMQIHSVEFEALRKQHAVGALSDENLRKALAQNGAFAAITNSDGRTQVIGTPIVPESIDDGNNA